MSTKYNVQTLFVFWFNGINYKKNWDIQGHLNTQQLTNINKLLTFCLGVVSGIVIMFKKECSAFRVILKEMKKTSLKKMKPNSLLTE